MVDNVFPCELAKALAVSSTAAAAALAGMRLFLNRPGWRHEFRRAAWRNAAPASFAALIAPPAYFHDSDAAALMADWRAVGLDLESTRPFAGEVEDAPAELREGRQVAGSGVAA